MDKIMIRDCFMCDRPISEDDCDKVNHDCNKCEYYKCEYCNYKEQCVRKERSNTFK